MLNEHWGEPCNYNAFKFSNFGFYHLNYLTTQVVRILIFFLLM